MGLLTGVLSLAREPVRLTLPVWELGLSSAASAARLGLDMLGQASAGPVERHRPPPSPFASGGPPDVADVKPPAPRAAEVVLVGEVAEDGAGPELHVEPPWDGYDQMTATQIRDRLTAASAELAAAVELYEATHRSCRTVLDAAERALKGHRRL